MCLVNLIPRKMFLYFLVNSSQFVFCFTASAQFVHKGDILFVIDQDRYRLALADAEATASARFAQHQMLLHQFERRSKLTASRTITQEDLENSRRAANRENALVDRL
jgi:multidrug resistance efflux pump